MKINKSKIKLKLKQNVNHNFFDKLNANSAWVLGWLMSDGNVHENRISLGIKDLDKNILEKISKLINLKNNIKIKIATDKTTSVRIQFRSNHMVSKLSKLGVIPRKSMKEIYPPKLLDLNQENLHRSFIRGYFEGDGCFVKGVSTFKIVGSKEILETINKVINQFLNIKCSIKHRIKELYELRIINDDVLHFCNWLYKYKGENYLERKYLIYLDRLKQVKILRKKQNKIRNIVKKIVFLRDYKNISWTKIGLTLKLKYPTQAAFTMYKMYKEGYYQ